MRGLSFSALSDQVGLHPVVLGRRHKLVPLFGAEMRNVDDRSRVVRQKLQDGSLRQRANPLRSLQDGQRAEQPGGVEFLVDFHGSER